MSQCAALAAEAAVGAGAALRAVDCLAGETVAASFARLFGGGGHVGLMPALTIALTLYIAFFALSLLMGRSRLGISALTPRMLTLGLVLTFATSWVAYSQVVWNLATGAPDEIASLLTGANGSATRIFADRMDLIFAVIADAAGQASQVAAPVAPVAGQAAQGAAQAASGSFTPGNLMWLSALMLLLGTVGVLVTARIALAVLLALGPVFIVLALFGPTRGLAAGWLRGLVLTAVTPLFVVIGGGIVMEMLVPVVAMLASPEGGVSGRAALALFVLAAVHLALMAMVMKVAGTIVTGWRVFGLAGDASSEAIRASVPASMAMPPLAIPIPLTAHQPGSHTAMPRALAGPITIEQTPTSVTPGVSSRTMTITQVAGGGEVSLASLPRTRARGIGSRFATPYSATPARAGGMIR